MGHSQGTAVTFAYLATKPKHAEEKVDMAIVCSTAIFFGGFFKKIVGKWIYNITVYTVVRMINFLIIKYLLIY